jgi:sugar lactone lactonase YvrE
MGGSTTAKDDIMRFRTTVSLFAASRLAASVILAAGLAQAGCSDDGPGSPDVPDASTPGPRPDAGAGPDGGATVDAGPGEPTVDGGPAIDGGVIDEPGVSTLAGSDTSGDDDGVGATATFSNPAGVAVGPDGNIYITDFENDSVRMITPGGVVSTLTEQSGFDRPFGIVFGADGTLYVQTDANDMRQVNPTTGTIWRVDLDSGEATVVVRNIGRPRGIAALGDGRLVLVDNPQHTISLLDPDAASPLPVPLAGAQGQAGYVDGTGTAARFSRPMGVAVVDDEIYVADRDNHRIRKITLDGVVTTVAGSGTPGSDDGSMAEASFNKPYALAGDGAGNLYVTELDGYVVRQIALDSGTVVTIAGDGTQGFLDHEDPLMAQFFGLEGIDVDNEGIYLYVTDGSRGEAVNHHRIRRVRLVE